MYILGSYRDLVENFFRLTAVCQSNPHKTKGKDDTQREGTRDSWSMRSLPDKRGRLVPMDQSCRLLYMCLAAHADNVEAERTYTVITNNTMSMWTGLGYTQTGQAKAKLRDTGWIATEKRWPTSNRTWIYRSPGNWEQQQYDEAKSADKAKMKNPAQVGQLAELEAESQGADAQAVAAPRPRQPKASPKPTSAEPKEWRDYVQSLIADARNHSDTPYPVCSRLESGEPLDDSSMCANEEEAEAICARVRRLLAKDCMAFASEQDGHWEAVLTQSLARIASDKLTIHCQDEHTVGKLPEILDVPMKDQWAAIQDLFCLGTRTSKKWLSKIVPKNNPPGMLYRLWPAIAAEFVKLRESNVEREQHQEYSYDNYDSESED